MIKLALATGIQQQMAGGDWLEWAVPVAVAVIGAGAVIFAAWVSRRRGR